MIGWYVHHHGHGHLHRALTVSAALADRGEEVVGLSTLPRPAGWRGGWVELERDDEHGGVPGSPDTTAQGRLHWVPVGEPGLRARAARIGSWLERHRPRLVVVDQSVEVCLLVRLHGVRVVGVTAPGRRDDPAHRLGFDVCDELVGAWPQGWADRLLPSTPAATRRRFHEVGAVSRFPVAAPRARRPGPPRVALLAGTGGGGLTPEQVAAARAQVPGWEWTVLSRSLGAWHPDPFPVLADADVVIAHAGQNSLAEVAAARTPAVVLPQPRPFDEQSVTAAALATAPAPGLPVVVRTGIDDREWGDVLEQARALDGHRWEAWCDGGAATRFADLLTAVGRSRAA